jgi:hypothetical protein
MKIIRISGGIPSRITGGRNLPAESNIQRAPLDKQGIALRFLLL